MKARSLLAGWLVLTAACATALPAESALPEEQGPVSRQEYDALKKDLEIVKRRLAEVEARQAAQPGGSELASELSRISQLARRSEAGERRVLIAGDAGFEFVNQRGSNNTFTAGLSPLLLWQVNDRVLFEGGIDMSLFNDPNGDNPGTETDLSLANVSYIVNDYVVAGGGLFAVPFGIYHSHLDARWTNKLPDDPLAMGDNGISPNTDTGIFAVGAFPVKGAVVNYGVYVTNGPTLITDDPGAAGSLSFDNNSDTNNNKAVGARVGFIPRPEFEAGYSIQCARANPDTFPQKVDALLQAVDFNYVKVIDRIGGTLTARGEWVWSHVDRATYDPTGALGFGPLTFSDSRSGGYGLVAYRPSQARNAALSRTEFVLRYDRLQASSLAPGGGTEERWTPGIDYWLTPASVLKIAYEFDDSQGGENRDALLFQFAVGF